VIILSSEPKVQFTSMYAVDNDVFRNLVYFSLFYEPISYDKNIIHLLFQCIKFVEFTSSLANIIPFSCTVVNSNKFLSQFRM